MVMEIASNLLFFHSIPSRQSIIKPITILEPTLSHHPHSSPAAHHTTLLIKYCYFNGFPFRHLIWYGTVVFHLFLPLTVNRDETDSNSRYFTDQQIPNPPAGESPTAKNTGEEFSKANHTIVGCKDATTEMLLETALIYVSQRLRPEKV